MASVPSHPSSPRGQSGGLRSSIQDRQRRHSMGGVNVRSSEMTDPSDRRPDEPTTYTSDASGMDLLSVAAEMVQSQQPVQSPAVGNRTDDSSSSQHDPDRTASSNDQTASPNDQTAEPKPKRRRRRKVNHACVFCRRSHMTCDLKRPCERCVKRSIGHLCRDEPSRGVRAANSVTLGAAGHPVLVGVDQMLMPTDIGPLQPPIPASLAGPAPLPDGHALTAGSVGFVDPNGIVPPPIKEFDGLQASRGPANPISGLDPSTAPSYGFVLNEIANTYFPFNSPELTSEYYLLNNFINITEPCSLASSIPATAMSDTFDPTSLALRPADESIPVDPAVPLTPFGPAPTIPMNRPSDPLSMSDSSTYNPSLRPAGQQIMMMAQPPQLPPQQQQFASLSSSAIPGLHTAHTLHQQPTDLHAAPGATVPQYYIPVNQSADLPAGNDPSLAGLVGRTIISGVENQQPLQPVSGNQNPLPQSAPQTAGDKTREYYMTAADPAGNDTPEVRMKRLLQAKYKAGLLRPFNHAKGYERLRIYMERHFQPDARQHILRCLEQFRPQFRERMRSLTDVELLMVEMWFERLLMDYDRTFASMSIPACCWRRTGEIVRGNKEMAELINVSVESLRDGKLSIHHIFTESSVVSYWDKFSAIAFDPAQEIILTTCTLKDANRNGDDTEPVVPPGNGRRTLAMGSISTVVAKGEVDCCCSLKVQRDVREVPALIVANFIPIIPRLPPAGSSA